MTVRANKPAFNIREKLKSLDYSHLPYEKIPAGTIIQNSVNQYTTPLSYSGSGMISTGITTSFYPKFSNSQILITTNVQFRLAGSYDHGIRWSMRREINDSGTITNLVQTNTNYDTYIWDGDGAGLTSIDLRIRIPFTVLDTPNTTEKVDYTLYFQSYRTDNSNIARINDNNNNSQLIVQEIKQ